ncbi:hypothetical protein [Sandaracinus amylolyticus]|uniref:Uncharacterized protein n=1 Tax=Sandaracinus amylolyticus TaxID=927083 RepID=A0A0F6SHE4_9BACT|nr:hypothetical protein [Sandaracinus amylolyticus]AKF10299.1 hypothetical protein DB32_007448 [Sandaracinus amylolyticus]
MSDDDISETRGKGEGELSLDFPRGRIVRLGALGALLGFPGLGLWVALIPAALLASSLSDGALTALLAITAPLTFAISLLLPPMLQRARAPRPARVTWDREGITEHDGPHVRTAIRWLDARARIDDAERGRVLQITDRDGRAITLATPRAAPRWLARRKACTPELDRLARVLVDVETGPEIAPDARDARRPTMGPQVALLTVALAAIALPMMWLVPDLRRILPAFGALLVCILCAAPALRPLHELLDLLALGRRFERSDESTIEEGEGREAIVKRKEGTWLRLDLSAARHPDAWLATRVETLVHAVLPLAGWVPSPQRLGIGPAVAVTDIETAHEREVRRDLVRAASIELAARGAAVVWWAIASLRPLWE